MKTFSEIMLLKIVFLDPVNVIYMPFFLHIYIFILVYNEILF